MDLKNTVVLVTGGASGLGLAYGTELMRNGVKLAILDLATSNGEESAKKLNAEFGEGRAIFVSCDVTKDTEFEASFAKTLERFGKIDIVINNAGIADDGNWELLIAVNVTGVVRGSLLGLKYMGKDRGGEGGVIVNISSIFGLEHSEYSPFYAASKHAVIGFTRSFGTPHHYNRTGVRFLTMCPGFTDTPMLAKAPDSMMDTIRENYSLQEVETVAEGIVDIIRSAKNGTVWVSETGETREVLIPDRFSMLAPAKNQ